MVAPAARSSARSHVMSSPPRSCVNSCVPPSRGCRLSTPWSGAAPAVGGGPVGVGKERRGRQDARSHSLTMPWASLFEQDYGVSIGVCASSNTLAIMFMDGPRDEELLLPSRVAVADGNEG